MLSSVRRGVLAASIGVVLGAAHALAADTLPASATAGLNWRLIGPFRGGASTMGAGVPDRPDTFYFGAAGGGVWKTVNAGRTWVSIGDRLPAASIGTIAVAPSAPDTLYVGSGQPEPRYDIAAGSGVDKSVDGGKTWTHLGLDATRTIGAIWVDPRDANTVLVGALGHVFGSNSERGVYRSEDGGQSWAHTLAIDDDTGVVDIEVDPANPDILYAAAWQCRAWPWLSYFTPLSGAGSAIYKSVDGGKSWSRLGGAGWPAAPLGRIGLAVTHLASAATLLAKDAAPTGTPPEGAPPPADIGPTRIYASVDGGKATDAGGIWRSDDDGASWQRVNADGGTFGSWYAGRLTVAPDDPNTVYSAGSSLRRSGDGGVSWKAIKGAPGGDGYHHLWINPAHPDHWLLSSDQGTVASVDGGASWSDWYNQPTGQFYHLAADNRVPYWIYSGQQDSGSAGIASRSDYGALGFRDWHPVGGDERDYMIPDPNDPNIVYGSGLGGRVSRFDARTGQVENVSPWPVSSYGKNPATAKYRYGWLTPLVAAPQSGTTTLYLGAQLLFKSVDQGHHWQAISADLTGKREDAKNCGENVAIADAKACGYGVISTIAPSPQSASEIWVGTDSGLIQLTQDGGAHWADVTPKQVPEWAKLSSLDVAAKEPGTAYAAIDNQRQDDFHPHILRTHDAGKSWQEIVGGLPKDQFVSVVRADPERRGLLYAGTGSGVYFSIDDGGHWQPLQQNLPTAWVRDLLPHGDDLIVATQGRAIWVMDNIWPLRQLAAGLASKPLYLFQPPAATRIHANNNRDTPMPSETPTGSNPPIGAFIDYWLGPGVEGPLKIEIRDADRKLIRSYSSEDKPAPARAERDLAPDWLKAPPVVSASPGMHRFIWDLRYPAPKAIRPRYSLAAVSGQNTPRSPAGALVPPGRYEVDLDIGGKQARALIVAQADPRVTIAASDYAAAAAFSQALDDALTQSWQAYAEQAAVAGQLSALSATLNGDPAKLAVDALAAKLSSGGADALGPGLESINAALCSLEADLEAADTAPSAVQTQLLSEANEKLKPLLTRWQGLRDRELRTLNERLKLAGTALVSVPAAGDLQPAEAGEDRPLP